MAKDYGKKLPPGVEDWKATVKKEGGSGLLAGLQTIKDITSQHSGAPDSGFYPQDYVRNKLGK